MRIITPTSGKLNEISWLKRSIQHIGKVKWVFVPIITIKKKWAEVRIETIFRKYSSKSCYNVLIVVTVLPLNSTFSFVFLHCCQIKLLISYSRREDPMGQCWAQCLINSGLCFINIFSLFLPPFFCPLGSGTILLFTLHFIDHWLHLYSGLTS